MGCSTPMLHGCCKFYCQHQKNTSPVEHGFTYLEMVASKRRKHLKPENLDNLFLLSALKVPIKSVTSCQAEIKYLEEAYLSFDFTTVYSYFNVQICYFIIGNKIFCFFKKLVFAFLDEGTFQGGR